MFSAYSQKVSELETKLEEQSKCIEELTHKVERSENQKYHAHVKNIPEEIQNILLSFQGELKDQSFVVNNVQSKVQCFKEDLNNIRHYVYDELAKQCELDFFMNILYDLRADVDKLTENDHNLILRVQSGNPNFEEFVTENSDQDQDVMSEPISCLPKTKSDHILAFNSALNPNVQEFKPRFPMQAENTENSTKKLDQDHGGGSDLDLEGLEEMSQSETESPTPYSPWSDPPTPEKGDFENPELMQYKTSSPKGSLSYKERVVMLENELDEKSRELEKSRQNATNQEEFFRKMDWMEHKVRLLKQDKKRRGETIGKLLRCIDDLRTCGKIDFNKATSEKAILTSTLSTRGMTHEERIQVAINVTEAEQMHEYCPDEKSPRFGADGTNIKRHGPSSPDDAQCIHQGIMRD